MDALAPKLRACASNHSRYHGTPPGVMVVGPGDHRCDGLARTRMDPNVGLEGVITIDRLIDRMILMRSAQDSVYQPPLKSLIILLKSVLVLDLLK